MVNVERIRKRLAERRAKRRSRSDVKVTITTRTVETALTVKHETTKED